jgi:hypothetical protein
MCLWESYKKKNMKKYDLFFILNRIHTKMSRIPNTAFRTGLMLFSRLTQDSEPRLVETLQEVRLPEDLPGLVQREPAQALHVVPVQDSSRPLGGGEARLSVHQQGHAGRQPLLCALCVVCIRKELSFLKTGNNLTFFLMGQSVLRIRIGDLVPL